MTEKRWPTHSLKAIKVCFASEELLQATVTALSTAARLGFERPDIVDTIQLLRPSHFYKSMTSFADHRIWHDVYHFPSPIGVLYIKFTADAVTEFVLLSFKEKNDGY